MNGIHRANYLPTEPTTFWIWPINYWSPSLFFFFTSFPPLRRVWRVDAWAGIEPSDLASRSCRPTYSPLTYLLPTPVAIFLFAFFWVKSLSINVERGMMTGHLGLHVYLGLDWTWGDGQWTIFLDQYGQSKRENHSLKRQNWTFSRDLSL